MTELNDFSDIFLRSEFCVTDKAGYQTHYNSRTEKFIARKLKPMRSYAAVITFLILSSIAQAQQVGKPIYHLINARSIGCELDRGTQASWDGGKLKLKGSNFGEGGKVTFDSIDTRKGKARLIGNVGAEDVVVLITPSGLTFVEQTAMGNLNFTTVFSAYDSSSLHRFIAVSSRHMNFNSPFPSQYHGTCSILEAG